MDRRQILVPGLLAAFLLTPAVSMAQEPDCSQGQPPAGSVQLTGPQVRVGDRIVAGPGARIEVTATDAAGGPAQWTPIVDGQEQGAWPASWTAGEHTAGAVAVDACGRRATLPPVAFTVDAEPPALRWETGVPETFTGTNRLAPDPEKQRRHRLSMNDVRPPDDSWISIAGVWQVPLPWVAAPKLKVPGGKLPPFHSRARFAVPIENEKPQAFLAAPGTVASLDGSDSTLGERLLWIAAEDQGAGVENMTLCLHEEGKDCPVGTPMASATSLVLRIEATDHVGNETRKEIVLRRGSQTASR